MTCVSHGTQAINDILYDPSIDLYQLERKEGDILTCKINVCEMYFESCVSNVKQCY